MEVQHKLKFGSVKFVVRLDHPKIFPNLNMSVIIIHYSFFGVL